MIRTLEVVGASVQLDLFFASTSSFANDDGPSHSDQGRRSARCLTEAPVRPCLRSPFAIGGNHSLPCSQREIEESGWGKKRATGWPGKLRSVDPNLRPEVGSILIGVKPLRRLALSICPVECRAVGKRDNQGSVESDGLGGVARAEMFSWQFHGCRSGPVLSPCGVAPSARRKSSHNILGQFGGEYGRRQYRTVMHLEGMKS